MEQYFYRLDALPDKCLVAQPCQSTKVNVTLWTFVYLNYIIAVCHRGGVLTPGAAFADTSLLDRLQCRGLQFTVIEKCWWDESKNDSIVFVLYCFSALFLFMLWLFILRFLLMF